MPEPETKFFLSMTLDAEDNSLVDKYASLRKTTRATAIRQLLHDHLPAMIQQLKRARRTPSLPTTEPILQDFKAVV